MRCKSSDVLGAWRHPHSWCGVLLLLTLAAAGLDGQTPGLTSERPNPLPATTGEALTIVPLDLQDIDCSIQEWNSGAPIPSLTLLCPPKAEFAPLRVYIKLSWLKPDDVPAHIGQIIVGHRGATKIRTNRREVQVLLEVAGEKGEDRRAKWVGFNGVADLALIKYPRHVRQ